MTDDATRRSYHGIAELILAGPQHRASGTIRLRVAEGGFGTVATPTIRVFGDQLVVDDQWLTLTGRTCRQLGDDLGLDVGAPVDLYQGGSGFGPDEPIATSGAAGLLNAFGTGEAALRLLTQDAGLAGVDATPVLWPEHFDVGISLDEVNYGVSPGDGHLGEPYAYVGPWQPRQGPFWNAPFGSARPLRDFADAAAVAAFFAEGRSRTVADVS